LLFGIAFAAAFLAKVVNFPILVAIVIIVGIKLWPFIRTNGFGTVSKFVASALISAALPVAGWCLWSKNHFGDLTGARQNMEAMGWTLKPFAEWWQHPI